MPRFEIPPGCHSWVEADGRRVFVEDFAYCVDTDWLWLRVKYARGAMAARIVRAVDVYLSAGGVDTEALESEVQLAVNEYIAIEQEMRGRNKIKAT
jgi:hypothetical protein